MITSRRGYRRETKLKENMKIKYADGTASLSCDTLSEAMDYIRQTYPDAVAYQDGSEADDDTVVERVLVWVDESSSVNDDGSKAIAEIVE